MDYKKVSSLITKKAFLKFTSSKQALDNVRGSIKRILTDDLIEFLQTNLPTKKKTKATLAVIDPKLAKV
jgi:hypothetical protein